MLKIFLAEDEVIVRETIKRMIPWEDLGFELVGEAADGEMALPLLLRQKPDLLITDIKMPFMDGLTLAKVAKKEIPGLKVVILSGYDDFNYAKQAINIGVEDYLLKPIKKADFSDMLHRMYARIEAKSGQAAYYQVLDGYARGLVGKEEVENVVSSSAMKDVGQRPGMVNPEGDQSATKIVRDALNYIKKHYNENISLTDVAEHVNVNKSYLCDVFKKEQKVTILQYMTNLRIEKAKELLLHTDMKMYEISVEVGYNDYTYFSQIFKRNTGSTLSEFRKKYARK